MMGGQVVAVWCKLLSDFYLCSHVGIQVSQSKKKQKKGGGGGDDGRSGCSSLV